MIVRRHEGNWMRQHNEQNVYKLVRVSSRERPNMKTQQNNNNNENSPNKQNWWTSSSSAVARYCCERRISMDLIFGLIFFFLFSLNGEWHTRHVASDCELGSIGFLLFVVVSLFTFNPMCAAQSLITNADIWIQIEHTTVGRFCCFCMGEAAGRNVIALRTIRLFSFVIWISEVNRIES